MSPKIYRIVWPDRAISLVTITTDDRGFAAVKVTGTPERLSNLRDYRTPSAVEMELHYIARKTGAKITIEETGA